VTCDVCPRSGISTWEDAERYKGAVPGYLSPNQRRCSEGLHGCRRSAFWEVYSRPLVTASSTPTSSSTSNRLQPRVCCTVSIPFASLSAHAMMDVWICSSFVFLACVGFVDPSCIFGVLAYLFLFASSFPGIRSLYRHGLVSRTTSPLGIKITSPKLDVGTPRCPNQYKLLCLLCQPSRSDTRTYKNLLTGNIKPDTLQFH
jgi:hypothetical protein